MIRKHFFYKRHGYTDVFSLLSLNIIQTYVIQINLQMNHISCATLPYSKWIIIFVINRWSSILSKTKNNYPFNKYRKLFWSLRKWVAEYNQSPVHYFCSEGSLCNAVNFYRVMLILKLAVHFKIRVCTIFISYVKQLGWIVFLQCIGNVEGFGHVYTRQGKLPGILPHTHTQYPNVADVTVELFAKSGMQW